MRTFWHVMKSRQYPPDSGERHVIVFSGRAVIVMGAGRDEVAPLLFYPPDPEEAVQRELTPEGPELPLGALDQFCGGLRRIASALPAMLQDAQA